MLCAKPNVGFVSASRWAKSSAVSRSCLKSVALDPNYTQVREYLGEAYVALGKFDLANEQLATIQNLCGGRECEEYEDLSDAINSGKIE
jgi:hypothetical protein